MSAPRTPPHGHSSRARRVAIAFVAVLTLAGAAAGCDDDESDVATTTTSGAAAGPTTTRSGSAGTVGDVLPPVVVDIGSIDGTTVDVAVGGVVDLTGGDDVTAWTADIDDPSIASFTAGREAGGATFNPGLSGLAEGSTEVTLTNGSTDETVTFTLSVTAR